MNKMAIAVLALAVTASAYGAEKTYLTADELRAFDGKNGKPAYVAVDGTVYDVTGVKNWLSGEHKGGKTGKDISGLIKKAPHGKKVLAERKAVGKLVPGMTLKELAAYDGQNGKPVYVAVNGLVYDQSGIAPWKNGEHKGGKGGTDISELIKKAPHGLKVFENRDPVAKIVTGDTGK